MSLTSSPPVDITELLRLRAVIPSDQQELLEKPDSWAIDLKDAPHGLTLVPDHVLETVEKAYRARHSDLDDGDNRTSKTNGSRDSASAQGDESNDDAPSSTAPPQSLPPSTPLQPQSSISRSRSPDRTQPRPQTHPESSVVRETPRSAPMAPPPRPGPRLQPAADSSDSSVSDGGEMETELPQAEAQTDAPVNRAAARQSLAATPSQTDSMQAVDTPPPCAQPSHAVIPSTAAETAVSPSKPIDEGRRRRHKPIKLGSSPINAAISTTTSQRMPTTKVFANDASSSSHSATSSSMIPSTCQDLPTSNPAVASIGPAVDHVATQQEIGQMGIDVEDKVVNAIQPPNRTDQSHPVVDQQPALATRESHPAHQLRPYQKFMTVYPDYVTGHAGSLWNFIKACVCVEFLQRERLLRECLYDDFIRAFSASYMKYVAQAGPGQEPLPAIEWFNSLPGAALYNEMVVTRQNLSLIIESYSTEVGKARNIIKADAEDTAQHAGRIDKRRPRLTEPTRQPREPSPTSDEDSAMDVDPPETAWTKRQSSRPPTSRTAQAGGLLTQTPPPPSPQLRSESCTPVVVATSPASARSERPRPSQYFEYLWRKRKRSSAEQERLLKHLSRKAGSRTGSAGSKAKHG